MPIAMPLSASRPVKAALANWLPWSVLFKKIERC